MKSKKEGCKGRRHKKKEERRRNFPLTYSWMGLTTDKTLQKKRLVNFKA